MSITLQTRSYPFRLMKIDSRGGCHPFITFFHDKKSYNALIDCGASHSLLSKDFFEDVPEENPALRSVGMGNDFSIWTITLDTLRLSGLNLTDVMLLKSDLSHINQSLSSMGFPAIDGILGCDLLRRLKAKIDFEQRQLLFQNAKQTHPLHLEGNKPDNFFTLTLTLKNKSLRLLLDTGASQTLLDLPVADALLPDITEWKINDRATTGISPDDILNLTRPMSIAFDNSGADDVPHWEVHFICLKMNRINHSYQSIGLPPVDAILGLDFLNEFCKNMDFKKRAISN